MSRRSVVLTLLVACVCAAAPLVAPAAPVFNALFGLRPSAPPPAMVFVYHGWHVDASRAAKGQTPQKTVRLIKAQLDLVEASGLKPAVLDAMRTTPVLVEAGAAPEAATYNRALGVEAHAGQLDAKKPVLLRQLLAGYYDRGLPAAAVVDVGRYRAQILARRAWPKSAAMLQNDRDFFAVTAAAYLHGAITREPYNRANLRKTQPDYYQWLARLFDDGRARR
jgi:hypothetical protein